MPSRRPHRTSTSSTRPIFTAVEQRFIELIMRTADLEKMTKCFDWTRMHALSGNTNDRVVHDSWSRLKAKLGVNCAALSPRASNTSTGSKTAKSKNRGHDGGERERDGGAGGAGGGAEHGDGVNGQEGNGEGEDAYDPIRRELRRQLREGFGEEMSEWSNNDDDDEEVSSSSPSASSSSSEYNVVMQTQHRNKRQKRRHSPSMGMTEVKAEKLEYEDEGLQGKGKGEGETMMDVAMALTRRGHNFTATGATRTTVGYQPQTPTRAHGGNRYHNYLPTPTSNNIGNCHHYHLHDHHHRHQQQQRQHQPAIVDGWDLLTPLKPFSPTPVSPTLPNRRHMGSPGSEVRVKLEPDDFGNIGPGVVEVVTTREGREVEVGSGREVAVDVDSW
ncbi:hypothetical protein EX30DRAFT_352187 [Ascodesmis nigricans]|uniref:Myb-like domain-containing protein n=1 Tax=Ascodesmis nigricans TaxID=341454 RepID=A0A4S2MJ69_9PEZI|nr:hypothetical protein EX30DRAFT_352187 [Ascodesmis nigricans]